MNTEIYTLVTGAFPERYHTGKNREGPVYGAQLMFTGPDAAIEVVGKKITPYLFGQPTDNEAFVKLIENYETSILKRARKLRKASGDRIVFTGVWYHLDFGAALRAVCHSCGLGGRAGFHVAL